MTVRSLLALLVFLMVTVFMIRCADDTAGTGSQTPNGMAGVVYLPDGATPAPGANVDLVPADFVPSLGGATGAVLSTVSDAHGAYAFDAAQAGTYNVQAGLDTLGGFEDSVVVAADGHGLPDIVLNAYGRIVGTTHLVGQSDTNQVRVTLYMPGTRQITRPTIGGGFSFGAVPAGRYLLIIDPTFGDYDAVILDIAVVARDTLDLDTIMLFGGQYPGTPQAYAGNDTTVSPNDTFLLSGSAADTFGTVVELAWDIGGTGSFAPTSDGRVVGVAPGSVTVAYPCVLRAVDDDSLVVYDTMVVHVIADPPRADAGPDLAFALADTVRVSAGLSSDSLGDITGYEWDVGATGVFTPGGADTAFALENPVPSSFPVVVRVTDDDGQTDTDTAVVQHGLWTTLGQHTTLQDARPLDVAVTGGTSCLVYKNSATQEVYMRDCSLAGWPLVGGAVTARDTEVVLIDVDSSGPWVALQQWGPGVRVVHYDGTWQQVGEAAGQASDWLSGFAVRDGTPYVAMLDGDHRTTVVRHVAVWDTIALGVGDSMQARSALAVSESHDVYVAVRGGDGHVQTFRADSGGVTPLGVVPLTLPRQSGEVSMVAAEDAVVLAVQLPSAENAIAVFRLTGTTWESLGEAPTGWAESGSRVVVHNRIVYVNGTDRVLAWADGAWHVAGRPGLPGTWGDVQPIIVADTTGVYALLYEPPTGVAGLLMLH